MITNTIPASAQKSRFRRLDILTCPCRISYHMGIEDFDGQDLCTLNELRGGRVS